jgi:small subunit ribosomal protein S1
MDSYSLDSLAGFLLHARVRYSPLTGGYVPGDTAGRRGLESTGVADSPERRRLWDTLASLKDCDQTVSVMVTGWNRGGLLVRWDDLQGFVPASQLADAPVFADDTSRDGILSRWVGTRLTLKVIELDQSRNRLVFSERAAAWAPLQGEQLLSHLSIGDVREGTVSNVCDFGAFVDLGGVDGLIHISEISWGRVIKPGNLLKIGDRVRVLVLSIDAANHHVGLSIKRLLQNPWVFVDDRYVIGDVVEAEVTNIVDYGAFVQLEQGLEGLVHISEMSDTHVAHPSEVLSVGQRMRVRVLRVDKEQHRLSLSMKHVPADGDGETNGAPEYDGPSSVQAQG